MILITGATGTVGSEVVKKLALAGTKVRAMSRHPAKLEIFKALGVVETVQADLSKPETLGPALKGVETVFLLTPASPEMVKLETDFIHAAKDAGVKKIVKLSAFGAEAESLLTLGKWHGEIEVNLKKSGLDWTILQPHMYMQNLFAHAGSIKAQGVFSMPAGDAKIGMVDVRDVAQVAVHALTEPGHQHQTYIITGPESLNLHSVATALTTALGKPVKYVPVSGAEAKKSMLGAGMPEWFVDALIEFFDVLATGAGDITTDSVTRVGKGKPHTFAQFAKDYAKQFN